MGARVVHLPAVKAKWQHLKDLPFLSVAVGRFEVLIGMNVPLVPQHYDIRCDSHSQSAPVGLLAPFGWTIVGRTLNAAFCAALPSQATWIRRHACFRHAEPLRKLLDQFLDVDPLASPTTKVKVTAEERIALKTMEDSVQFNETRYEIGLLWKSTDIVLPNNREAALKRLFSTGRRLLRSASMVAFYNRTIQQYVEEGHAGKLPHNELDGPLGRTWYLPHHAVEHPRKPGNYRIVFDAYARHAGLSLNDCLLKGPEYLANLVGVLLRFRRNPVPISADIQRMYHQVLVSPKDRSALRFLWRELGTNRPPETYEMLVRVFGTTSSPSVCMFAVRRAALDSKLLYPGPVNRIMSNMYVDNWLDSFDTDSEAVDVSLMMKNMLASAGFHLMKWATTSRVLLDNVAEEQPGNSQVRMFQEGPPTKTALGMKWDCETDCFQFNFPKERTWKPTKRKMLSLTAQLFDPPGLLSPPSIGSRIILQDLWRTDHGWDDVPDEHFLSRWQRWAEDLRNVETIRFPPCLQPKGKISSIHLFSDASDRAYAAVGYVQCIDKGSRAHVTLAMAKARVAPLRRLSTPRLELSAALIAAGLARVLITELNVSPSKVTFWTDSSVVLCWIKATNKRFSAFVENRITEILDGFDASQWRHFPSSENAADDLSRGLNVASLTERNRWIDGPAFLCLDSHCWPKDGCQLFLNGDALEEVVVTRTVLGSLENVVLSLINRRSSYDKLLRIMTYIHMFIMQCRKEPRPEVSATTPAKGQGHGSSVSKQFKRRTSVKNNAACKAVTGF